MIAWSQVTIGVADLDKSLDLWNGVFGLEVIKQAEGDDAGLNQLWKLQPGDISRQALLATPGKSFGKVHLVEFKNPGSPVREGAKPTDSCPKNLDLYVDDLAAKLETLRNDGCQFKSENYTELTTPDGTKVREIHMHGHDQTNIVFLEIIGKSAPFSSKGFAGIGPLVTTVPDASAEHDFYKSVLCLDSLHSYLLDGPEIEQMIGLPPGCGLDMRVMGNAEEPLGQIEIIEYQGANGENLYPLAQPKSLGILGVAYQINDLADIQTRLQQQAVEYQVFENTQSIVGKFDALRFKSPAGMNIEVHQY